jgi:two-component system cell cycle sensor histidine kinase/response regulator CckA
LQYELERLRHENAELKGQLQRTENWAPEIFTAFPNLISITRIDDGKILFMNKAVLDFCGYSSEEINGTTTVKLGLWVDQCQREIMVRKLAAEGTVQNFETDFRRKDGEIRQVLLAARPITYKGESSLFTIAVDISDRKKIETALRESEERFLLITNTIDEIFYIFDAEKGVATYLSPAFERIWGYGRENALNSKEPFLDPVHPEDREIVMDWGPRLSGGEPVTFEYRIIRPDGSIRHISDHGYPIAEKDGKVTKYVGTGHDVTEWRHTEAALRESREYLDQIINRIGDPIAVKDHEHRFVLANDAFCTFFKIRREDLIGNSVFSSLPEALAETLMRDEKRVLETGVESQTEDVVPDWQGQEHILITKKSRFIDKDGNRQIVLVWHDITEYKRLEAQFLQSQKMEAIGVLAGGVAHDFNNLLNVINGYSEMVLEALEQDNPVRRDIEQIREAGDRAATLTSQLLAFGRKQILQPKYVDLNHIITEMGAMLRRLIGEDIDFDARTFPDLGLIYADPVKIQQVVMNLAVNARDAMPRGGKLTLETANVDFDRDYLKAHSPAAPGAYIMLAISDSGMGMDPETQTHIFEPFFTTKEKGKGSGLGLANVYGIVKQSNGFIWVYSEPGKGTTFKIYFPRVEGRVNSGAVSQSESGEPESGSETILLVEDEKAVRDLASRILRDLGYTVIESGGGAQALDLAKEFEGEIHLIVTDVVMPGMSGNVLVSELEATRPEIKALFISGYTDNAIVHHGILDSSVAFLQKPFSVNQLAQKVRAVLNS